MHSRTASNTIGNFGYCLATSSSCADRWRCCHNGARLPGFRLGSSRARAAHSRNREAKSAEFPTCSATIASTSSGSIRNRSDDGSAAESGTRSTMPSSEATGWASIPVARENFAPAANAHAALTPRP